jgi:hypothetical protein
MKTFSFLVTSTTLLFLAFSILILTQALPLIFILFICCFFTGLYYSYLNRNAKLTTKDIGWGLLYGALTSFVILISVLIWFGLH